MAELKKLRIARWDVENRKEGDRKLEVMFNPGEYTLNDVVDLSRTVSNKEPHPQQFTLPKIVFDGTGVVPTAAGTTATVEQWLSQLRAILQDPPENDKVVYPVVLVIWGALFFVGTLASMRVTYTLFAPDGTPLRASVAISLAKHADTAVQKLDKRDERVSARQLTVQGEIRLPELCFQAYRDPELDKTLARKNGLTSIRNVPPGTKLVS